MAHFNWVLAATVLVSLTAWLGILTVYLKDDLLDRLLLVLVALAAGTLVGGAFLHLLPEAIEQTQGELTTIFAISLVGFCTFYVLEQFVAWHHHHEATHYKPVSVLVLASDTVHNFLDGIVIAGAFLADVRVGLVTTAVIGLHEIPQEISDFGVLVYSGFSRRKALVLNYLTQASIIVGGVVGVLLSDAVADLPTLLLPFAAGSFLYVAASDLIPEIKSDDDVRRNALHFGVFAVGLVLMFLLTLVE